MVMHAKKYLILLKTSKGKILQPFIIKKFNLNDIAFEIELPTELEELYPFFSVSTELKKSDYSIYSKIIIADNIEVNKPKVKISNNFFKNIDNNWIYIFDSSISITINNLDKKAIHSTIHIKEFKVKNFIRLLNIFRKNKRNNVKRIIQANYVQALRHSILYPYFLMLNQKDNISISHGSSFINKDDKAISVIGFDGIGKSTIASLMKTDNYSLMTDNFIVYNNEFLFFVPEPLRLLDNNSFAYGKKYEKIPLIHSKVYFDSFIFTYLGESFSFQKEDPSKLHKKNKYFWNYLPEFIDFQKYLTALEMINDNLNYDFKNVSTKKEFTYYESSRNNLHDNKRMVNELQKI